MKWPYRRLIRIAMRQLRDRRIRNNPSGVRLFPMARARIAVATLQCAVKSARSTGRGKTRPGTGSIRPVALGAAAEARKPLKPPAEGALGDLASLQVVAGVNSEQAAKTWNAGADVVVVQENRWFQSPTKKWPQPDVHRLGALS